MSITVRRKFVRSHHKYSIFILEQGLRISRPFSTASQRLQKHIFVIGHIAFISSKCEMEMRFRQTEKVHEIL